MAKTVPVAINQTTNVNTSTRRPAWDGHWDDTALQQVITPLLQEIEQCGLCNSPGHLTRALLAALGDHLAHGVLRGVVTIRHNRDMINDPSFSQIERTLEIAEGLLQQLGMDGTPAGAECEAPLLVPPWMLPHLEMCLNTLEAWQNDFMDEIEAPVFMEIYMGGKVLMGDVEVDDE